jgi:ribosomal protein L11 methylase PrmA
MRPETQRVSGSFRDPSGFVFVRGDEVLRTVHRSYAEHYDALIASGLYDRLAEAGLLVTHEEIDDEELSGEGVHRVLRAERIPFVSYPYEWSFSQLKDAALLTLRVATLALEHDLILKDASAYNVQFVGYRPVLIDTLSFETYTEGEPWIGYRQFCQHFLAPLALMARVDVRMALMLRDHLDGIPLDLASALLSARTRLSPSLLAHVHMHARAQSRYADSASEGGGGRKVSVSKRSLVALLESLRGAVAKLDWEPAGTEWGDYYDATNYSASAMEEKSRVVCDFLERAKPRTVWDLGANTGRFSRIACDLGCTTVAFDIDGAAVEKGYRDAKARSDENLLPLVMDLTNPSPDLGWRLAERDSLVARGRADVVVALALIHHLAISNNVPLGDVAAFFASLADRLIVEWVPKTDSQVERLLASREDIFGDYTQDGFEAAFASVFEIEASVPVEEGGRVLYLMRRRDG